MAALATGASALTWVGAAQTRPSSGSIVLRSAGAGFPSTARLAIGSARTSRVAVRNAGSLTAELVLTATVAGDGLSRRLRLDVTRLDGEPHLVYSGTLAAFETARAGRLAAGGTAVFRVRLRLPPTGSEAGDDALREATTDVRFAWAAVGA